MKKIDMEAAGTRTGSRYPPPFNETGMDKVRRRLGQAAGLTEFGANLLTLRPGVWSSPRHWRSRNDEFLFVVSGEVTLVTDEGEEVLKAGDCAGFKAGDPDGHHLVNRSNGEAVVLEMGTDHPDDVCTYADIDMISTPTGYVHKDGTPYLAAKR